MRIAALLIAAISSISSAKDPQDIVYGHVHRPGVEVELYTINVSCKYLEGQPDAMDASRYPPGQRHRWVEGCAKHIGDGTYRVKFKDGVVIDFQASEIVRRGKYAPKPQI